MTQNARDETYEELTRPLRQTSRAYWYTLGILLCGVCWGLIAWMYQCARGLGRTGMSDSVTWGVYITNFVFFIGISHAGTLISAILRVSRAEWRRPITRAAEAITVFALVVGGLQILFDIGHPERILNVIIYGRFGSPLLWDVTCISVYLLSCIFYLLLPLIPDLGRLRDEPGWPGWRQKLYTALSFGWKNQSEQKRRLEKAIGVMAVAIIPIAVSVHTVVSWIFGMTVRPMWHSSIFGPYFVTGAIFSGIAAIIIGMAVIRRVYHFENYLKPIHFDYLGMLLIAMCALWFYFTFAEYLTTGYGGLSEEMPVFRAKVAGSFQWFFWGMVACMAIAFLLLAFRRGWVISATTSASVLIVIGMWLERYTIVVPTLTRTAQQGYRPGIYQPTWVEWSITAGSCCGFILLYVVFAKLFPLISVWEMEESQEAIATTVQRMQSYLPDGRAVPEPEPVPQQRPAAAASERVPVA